MVNLSKETVEAWIKCDCANRGVTRLEAIENFLKLDHDEFLDSATEPLMIEWLNASDAKFKVKYDGGFTPDYITVDTDAANRVIGFRWQLAEDIGRDCDESYGSFSVEILGYKFVHCGVSYFNEEMWCTDTWDGKSQELSDAIDAHTTIPHVEDYIDEKSWGACDIDKAFDQMFRNSGRDVDGLLFYRDDNNGVYVFEGERRNNEHFETVLVPLKKVPDNLISINQEEACKILAEQDLPFEQD